MTAYTRPAYDLDEELCRFDGHPWTPRDSFEGTHIFGQPGSGKSTGSGRALAHAFIENGYGGLVLTCSTDEADRWQRYMEEKGRSRDLIRVAPRSRHRFNFLQYEAARPPAQGGGIAANIAALFVEAMNTQQVAKGDNAYWVENTNDLITYAIDVILCSGRELDLKTLSDVIHSAPTTRDPKRLVTSLCAKLIREACQRKSSLTPDQSTALENAVDYFGSHFPAIEHKQRHTFITAFTSQASKLLNPPHREMFATKGEDTFDPRLTHNRKVIVLDFPFHLWKQAGIFAQRLYKLSWQSAATLRGDREDNLPMFLWCDEAHNFVGPAEADFQSGCRKYRVAGVYITQNLPLYFMHFGGSDPINGTQGFLDCLNTHIFHQNISQQTNEWAEKLFATKVVPVKSVSHGSRASVTGQQTLMDSKRGDGKQIQTSPQDRPRVPRILFSQLEKGGPPNYMAQTIMLYRNGHVLSCNFPTRS